MIGLSAIKGTAQDVAEAISASIGVETEIIDNTHHIIAGTGRYFKRVGQIEECGGDGTDEIYGSIFRTGCEFIVENALTEPNYWGYENELAEICCPIIIENKVIGIIGLVAFTQEQKDLLLSKQHDFLDFIRKMAVLLASKVLEVKLSNGMKTILQSIHEGIISVDAAGRITEWNLMAETLTKRLRSDAIGKNLYDIWKGSPIMKTITSGIGYNDSEEIYTDEQGRRMHFVCSASPVMMRSDDNEEDTENAEEIEKCIGAVVSFRDIASVRKFVYDMTEKKTSTSIDEIVGVSPQICELKEKICKIADSKSTVMITGESGTGKSMVAKAIHFTSQRKEFPFVTVNCGAIPDNLIESELFGYEEGSFTGAKKNGKMGKFELANKGTIFLDEIGDLPLHLQVKLLHVLQTGKFERLGGNREIDVDVRIIVATNRNLEQMVIDKEFREDLYFRFNVIPLSMPPLRERREDIVLLLSNALTKYNRLLGKGILGFSEEAIKVLQDYKWNGNVRELENVVEYAVNMETEKLIGVSSFPRRLTRENCSTQDNLTLDEQCKLLERQVISDHLNKLGYSVESKRKVAESLGLSEATLYRKMRELKIGLRNQK